MQSRGTQDIREHAVTLKDEHKLQEKLLKCYVMVVTPVFPADIFVSYTIGMEA